MAKIAFKAENYRRMISAIEGVQNPQSVASQGERLAAMVISRSQAQLTNLVASGDPEVVNKMADTLGEAAELMRSRLDLIESALARLIVVDDPDLNAEAQPQA